VDNQVDNEPAEACCRAVAVLLEQAATLMRAGSVAEANVLTAAAQRLLVEAPAPSGTVVPLRPRRLARTP
jgi:hypothetical protein